MGKRKGRRGAAHEKGAGMGENDIGSPNAKRARAKRGAAGAGMDENDIGAPNAKRARAKRRAAGAGHKWK